MPFKTEPAFSHGQAPRTAVVLCNLGTPDEPTAPALRRYLAEFLSDHRVVEIPKALWMLILLSGVWFNGTHACYKFAHNFGIGLISYAGSFFCTLAKIVIV